MEFKRQDIWVALIVLGLIFMCGCMGGGPSDDGAEPSGESPTTTAATSATGGGISIESILGLGKPSGYTAAYNIEFSGGEEAVSMVQKHYVSGEKLRLDMEGDFYGQATEVRSYSMGNMFYSCMKTEGAWTCMEFASEEDSESDMGFDVAEMEAALEDYLSQPTYDGTMNIAGVQAQCFKISFEEGSARYCMHPQYAIPLYVESIDKAAGQEGYYRMAATSFSAGSPQESVFELPAEPMDMEAFMNQAMAGMDMQ